MLIGVLGPSCELRGAGLQVATRDIQPGEVVVEEPPYAYAVSEGEAENICSAEMREVTSEQGSLCGGCRFVRCALILPIWE